MTFLNLLQRLTNLPTKMGEEEVPVLVTERVQKFTNFPTKMDEEAVPILLKETVSGPAEEITTDTSFRCGWPLLRGEMKKLLMIAVPMIVRNLLLISLQFVSLMIVGHLSDLALSSASVAISFANVTGFSFLVGLASALDTLCGQAFGAKQYHLHGVLMQRAIFILFCSSIPFCIIFLFMEDILLACGQDPTISSEAGAYARWLIPGLIAYVFLHPMAKYLQTQSIVIPLMLASAFTLVVHAPLCWFMVYRTGLGIRGSALSTCISYWFNVLLLSLYIKFSDACKNTRIRLSKEAFHDITSFLKISIPSTIMTCMDWWCFEILVLLAGKSSNPQLEASVLSICLSTASVAYAIPNGLGSAASTRVSNELGAENTRGAVLAARAVLCISLTEITLKGTILFSLKNTWGHLYSNDSKVLQYMSTMMPIVALTTMMDGIQGVLSGIVRGCGLQKWGAYVNIAAFYGVGIPLIVIIAFFVHFSAKGLWLGIQGGVFSQTMSLLLVIVCHDWNKLAKRARERVYESALPREDSCKQILNHGAELGILMVKSEILDANSNLSSSL